MWIHRRDLLQINNRRAASEQQALGTSELTLAVIHAAGARGAKMNLLGSGGLH